MGYRIAPYINFRDEAEQALEFYRSVLGGTVSISRMSDYPSPELDEADRDKVMHGQLDLENGFTIMASDAPASMSSTVGDNISVTVFGDDPDELRGFFDALTEHGTVVVPFAQAPWGDYFGMLVDPFGVHWMINSATS